jgi:hypothetical protein
MNIFSYGMYHGRPCLILKLNNIYGWEPEPYYNISEVQYRTVQYSTESMDGNQSHTTIYQRYSHISLQKPYYKALWGGGGGEKIVKL